MYYIVIRIYDVILVVVLWYSFTRGESRIYKMGV